MYKKVLCLILILLTLTACDINRVESSGEEQNSIIEPQNTNPKINITEEENIVEIIENENLVSGEIDFEYEVSFTPELFPEASSLPEKPLHKPILPSSEIPEESIPPISAPSAEPSIELELPENIVVEYEVPVETTIPEESIVKEVIQEPISTVTDEQIVSEEPVDETIISENTHEETNNDIQDQISNNTHINISDFERSGRNIIAYGSVVNNDRLNDLEKLLDSYSPNISLAVYSLDGSSGLIYNGKYEYPSQCTVKISWCYYLCTEIDKGTYSPQDILTYIKEDRVSGSSNAIRKNPYGTQYTLEEIINLCLTVSDNCAYKMITRYIDKSGFDAFIDERGYQSFKLDDGKLWSYNSIVTDFASIWSEIYDYLQTDTVGSNILRNACTNTPYNYGTQTLKDEEYSHKSGWYSGSNVYSFNDAGIVWADQPYVYAVFTKSKGTKSDKEFINKVMTIVHEIY